MAKTFFDKLIYEQRVKIVDEHWVNDRILLVL